MDGETLRFEMGSSTRTSSPSGMTFVLEAIGADEALLAIWPTPRSLEPAGVAEIRFVR